MMLSDRSLSSLAAACRGLLAAALLAGVGLAHAQFSMVPAPLPMSAPPRASEAEVDKEYRIDAARHIYAMYPMRVFRGKLPPMMYAVMITDTELDPAGNVVAVTVAREPAAAKEVSPWVVALIRRATPFPAPAKLRENANAAGNVVYRDIWLVDKSGLFQVDTLTEGQR